MRNMRKFYITFVSIMTIAIILPNLTAFASFKPPEDPMVELSTWSISVVILILLYWKSIKTKKDNPHHL